MTVSFQDVIFAFDCSRIETVGGVRYLWDYGPNGLHFAFPGGAADPTPQLDGSLSFDGGDYLSLPAARLAEFYAKMPSAQYTFAVSTSMFPVTATAPRLFSCESVIVAANYGIAITLLTTAVAGNSWNICNSGAVVKFAQGPAGFYNNLRRSSMLFTMETTTRILDMASYATTWAAGAYGAPAYDTVTVPRIGTQPTGGGACTGRIHYLALVRNAISSPDMAQLSAMLAAGIKPFCWRAS